MTRGTYELSHDAAAAYETIADMTPGSTSSPSVVEAKKRFEAVVGVGYLAWLERVGFMSGWMAGREAAMIVNVDAAHRRCEGFAATAGDRT